jgi:hypothetical protein
VTRHQATVHPNPFSSNPRTSPLKKKVTRSYNKSLDQT